MATSLESAQASRSAASGVISVVLADDHPIVRAGISAVLASDAGFRLLGEAATGDEAIRLVKQLKPRVLVTDVRLPGLDGIEVCAHVTSCVPSTRVIVLTQFAHESVMVRAFRAGARGFVVKESDPELLRGAIRAAAGKHTYVDPRVASRVVSLATRGRRARGPFGLTHQEMRVLEYLPKGLTNREIAEELAVSPETIKTHLRHAMRKLQVNDRAEAASLAVREGLA